MEKQPQIEQPRLRAPAAEVAALAGRGELPGRHLGALGWRFGKATLQAWLEGHPSSAPNTTVPLSAAGDERIPFRRVLPGRSKRQR